MNHPSQHLKLGTKPHIDGAIHRSDLIDYIKQLCIVGDMSILGSQRACVAIAGVVECRNAGGKDISIERRSWYGREMGIRNNLRYDNVGGNQERSFEIVTPTVEDEEVDYEGRDE